MLRNPLPLTVHREYTKKILFPICRKEQETEIMFSMFKRAEICTVPSPLYQAKTAALIVTVDDKRI
jgi:hypothetical protein